MNATGGSVNLVIGVTSAYYLALAGHEVKGVTPLAALLAAVTALPLVARRRHPLAVLATVRPEDG